MIPPIEEDAHYTTPSELYREDPSIRRMFSPPELLGFGQLALRASVACYYCTKDGGPGLRAFSFCNYHSDLVHVPPHANDLILHCWQPKVEGGLADEREVLTSTLQQRKAILDRRVESAGRVRTR